MLDELKSEISFDKYVCFLLGLGFSKDQTAKLCRISRAGVYKIITRNYDLLLQWGVEIPSTEREG